MANVFLDSNDTFQLANGAQVFGRSGGNETVALQSGVTGVGLDANVERLDFAQASGDVSFQVTGDGLTVRQDGTTLVTIPSLNQTSELRFTDGNVTIEQTGASEFTITGDDGSTQTVGTQASTSLSVALGDDTSSTAPDSRDGPVTVDVSATNTGPFDASEDDVTYNLATGSYTAAIEDFDSGDKLRPFDEASVTVSNDSDQTDGVQRINFADPRAGTTATLELTGLTDSQDEGLFNRESFNDVFGDGTIPTPDDGDDPDDDTTPANPTTVDGNVLGSVGDRGIPSASLM